MTKVYLVSESLLRQVFKAIPNNEDAIRNQLRTLLAKEPNEPVAWEYDGESYFDGKKWYDTTDVTNSKEVADFKSGTIKKPTPLYRKDTDK